MEQQLDALTLQLESMKAKNTETAGHNSALDKAIAFKDYEVAKLQESNHVSVEIQCSHRSGTKTHMCQLELHNSTQVSCFLLLIPACQCKRALLRRSWTLPPCLARLALLCTT